MGKQKADARGLRGGKDQWDDAKVELAVERALKSEKQRQVAPAPPEGATCFICLDDRVPLKRSCACRGATGYAHLECLVKLAVSKEVAGDGEGWSKCVNCKKEFTGSLRLEMMVRFWRRHKRSAVRIRKATAVCLGNCLRNAGEHDAAAFLDPATKFRKARMIADQGKLEDALALLKDLKGDDVILERARILFGLRRYGEARQISGECLARARKKFGPDHNDTHHAIQRYAMASGMLGHVQEADNLFHDVLTSQNRVFGPDHPETIQTRRNLVILHYTMIHHAANLGDTMEASRFVDAVLPAVTRLDDDRSSTEDTALIKETRWRIIALLRKLGRAPESQALALTFSKRDFGRDSDDALSIQRLHAQSQRLALLWRIWFLGVLPVCILIPLCYLYHILASVPSDDDLLND